MPRAPTPTQSLALTCFLGTQTGLTGSPAGSGGSQQPSPWFPGKSDSSRAEGSRPGGGRALSGMFFPLQLGHPHPCSQTLLLGSSSWESQAHKGSPLFPPPPGGRWGRVKEKDLLVETPNSVPAPMSRCMGSKGVELTGAGSEPCCLGPSSAIDLATCLLFVFHFGGGGCLVAKSYLTFLQPHRL